MLQNTKKEGGPFGDIEKHSKVSQSRKGESLIVPKKVEISFGVLVKLAHTPRLEHEPFGLRSKDLTTTPRTPELCDLPAVTRGLSRAKKHQHFPITLAYRKCNIMILYQ